MEILLLFNKQKLMTVYFVDVNIYHISTSGNYLMGIYGNVHRSEKTLTINKQITFKSMKN